MYFVELIAKSKILSSLNLEVGVFVGDNDSSSIASIRRSCDHQVVKLSDKNHTAKGVTNALYNIPKKDDKNKELTSESIKYLHRSFTYAMAQHKGDSFKMADAVRNIPYHAFNMHDKCGDFCGYKKDPANYKHSSVPGGFTNPILFNILKKIFEKLADNATSYAAGLSSNSNEALNATMAQRCPKRVCFSQSESADFRFASAVAQKNRGEGYLKNVLDYLDLSHSKHLHKMISNVDATTSKRRATANTHAFKLKRLVRRKNRSKLRHKKENMEGITYKSHVGLFQDNDSGDEIFSYDHFPQSKEINEMYIGGDEQPGNHLQKTKIIFDNICLVFFDLETSGFQAECDILQVAMKCGDFTFAKYLTPGSAKIHPKATEANGLRKEGTDLYWNDKKVPTEQPQVVVQKMYNFLKSLDHPSVLIAHNCSFDAPRLMRLIMKESRVQEVSTVIMGFVDTLPLFKNKFPERKERGACSLTTLASETMSLPTEGAHNALYDVIMLEKLSLHHFQLQQLVEFTPYLSVVESVNKADDTKKCINTLDPLKSILSDMMIKRIAAQNITFNLIVDTYCDKGWEATKMLLQHNVNGKAQGIKFPKMLNDIHDYLCDIILLIQST